MSFSTDNLAYLLAIFKLVKEQLLECPLYSLRKLIDNRWLTINYFNNIRHVAILLVTFLYKTEMQSALKMLNILSSV